MMQLFHDVSQLCSKITTEKYSTSFSSAARLLHYDLRAPIYNIYGFVRFADEVVDTFHDYEKDALLLQFKHETYQAITRKISLNPILHSFQMTVNDYGIDLHLIEAFFESMQLDIQKKQYDIAEYKQYIYGSAETVGLMCLYIFCEGNKTMYEKLKSAACSLGAAFQKVNFLRDLRTDYQYLNRIYFPECNPMHFSEIDKRRIEADIEKDFAHAYEGILALPLKARFGVYVAYKYYFSLYKKIKKLDPQKILQKRIRIPSYNKIVILAKAGLRSQFNAL